MSLVLETAVDRRPGMDPRRLVRLMHAAVRELELDLSERVVVTEAATGAYGVTPVLAGLAGARAVYAVAGDSRFGTAAEARAQTQVLAAAAGVEQRIAVVMDKDDAPLEDADIVTNSGHLRPLNAEAVGRMKPGAAIPLMYEAWELRPEDVDLVSCRRRGVRVAGTNERHPAVGVFPYLGPMAVKLLFDAGVAGSGGRGLVLCDNPFRDHVRQGLVAAGAHVVMREHLNDAELGGGWDAVLVALRPAARLRVDAAHAERLAEFAPGAVLLQFWGNIDREALSIADVPVW